MGQRSDFVRAVDSVVRVVVPVVDAGTPVLVLTRPGIAPRLAPCGLPMEAPARYADWNPFRLFVDGAGALVFEMTDQAAGATAKSLPVRVAAAIGAPAILVVGQATARDESVTGGGPWVVADHVNLVVDNPLVGANEPAWGPRFPDMSEPYDPEFRALAREAGCREVLFAEIGEGAPAAQDEARRLAWSLGCDVVGSGVVPLAVAAAHARLRFAALLVGAGSVDPWTNVVSLLEALKQSAKDGGSGD